MLRLRALASLLTWLPAILDATRSGDLLFALPSAGLLLGIAPVAWFPAVGAAQVVIAGATLVLVPRLDLTRGWLFSTAFALALLLNAGLWLRARRSAAQPVTTNEKAGAAL